MWLYLRKGGLRRLSGCFVLGLGMAAGGSLAAEDAAGKPSYFEADTTEIVTALGGSLAARVLSDELTPQRIEQLSTAVSSVPDLACPSDLKLSLTQIYPVGETADETFWIERYKVHCNRDETVRLMLNAAEGDIAVTLLTPGETIADPVLEGDARKSVLTAAEAAKPVGCDVVMIVDTAIVQPPEAEDAPWKERWSVSACQARLAYDVSFTPAPDEGGTAITVLAVKK